MKYPCVFATEFQKEQINPRLAKMGKVPFGDFTRTWRREHCARINPYGSAGCPYALEDCSIAFFKIAELAMAAKNPGAYFKVAAAGSGISRADTKPLAREMYSRTDGQQARGGGIQRGTAPGPDHDVGEPRAPQPHLPADVIPGVDERRAVGLRRSSHRPQSMGSLLRGDDPGPRSQPYRRNKRQESPDNTRDGRDRVRLSPPEQSVGNEPPSGDPEVHTGGE